MEKIVLFYMSRKGDISRELLEIRGLEGLQGSERLVEYRRVAEDVLHLLHFLEYNIAALHHILRKHDRQFDLNMSSLYFETRLSLGPHSGSSSAQLVQLYHQEELKAIISTLRRGLEDAYDCERVSLGITDAYNTNFFMGPSLGSGNRRQGSFSVIPRGSFGKQYRSSNELRRLHSAKNLMRPNGRSFHRASDYLKSGAGKGETPALTRSISELEPIRKPLLIPPAFLLTSVFV